MSRPLYFLALVLALVSSRPFPARAEPPSPRELTQLDDRLLGVRKIRITTPTGWIVTSRVRVSADGLAYLDTLVTYGGAARSGPGLMSWDDIDRIDAACGYGVRMALVSVVVVGIIGSASYRSEHEKGNDFAGVVPMLVGVPAVALATGVGAATHGWKLVYKKRRAPKPIR